eukprot:SAG22_NODE_513_length_9567_cov_25.867771_2_plen_79_part_00
MAILLWRGGGEFSLVLATWVIRYNTDILAATHLASPQTAEPLQLYKRGLQVDIGTDIYYVCCATRRADESPLELLELQ